MGEGREGLGTPALREGEGRRRVGANDDTKEGRFDSTKISEAFSFRKVGAIELRCFIAKGVKQPN